jgi:hypothetical protein
MGFTLQPGCPPSLTLAVHTADRPRDFEFRECFRRGVSGIIIISAPEENVPELEA